MSLHHQKSKFIQETVIPFTQRNYRYSFASPGEGAESDIFFVDLMLRPEFKNCEKTLVQKLSAYS